jgi:UDP-glucose 4-epimerase
MSGNQRVAAGRSALVTGAAGFIGSVLARLLLSRGYDVTGLDNFSRGSREAIADLVGDPRFTFIEGDIRSEADVTRAFARRPRLAMHLAARHFIPECAADPAGTYDINVVGTERVWSGAAAHGAERFLFVSTGDVYTPSDAPHVEGDATEPFNVYGLSKLTSERSLQIAANVRAAPALVIARMFNVYGAGDRNDHLIPAVLRQARAGTRRLELGNMWPVRDYIYVADAAEALCRLAEAGSALPITNVGTGGGWSVEQVVRAVGGALGVPLEPVSLESLRRPSERDVLRPNIERLMATTGWHPRRALEGGLREFLRGVEA